MEIEIARDGCSGQINYVGDDPGFNDRAMHPNLVPDPELPESVRMWAALQNTGGGTWGGCLPDINEVIRRLG